MVKDEECNNPIGAKDLQAWSMGKPCDACRIKSSLLYCKADSAYLCVDCDVKVHRANKLASRHERLWMCDVCEQAPAAVTCKADAAVLCLACDDDIHSANPLARRHDRLPVAPFFECARLLKPSLNYSDGGGGGGNCFGSEGLEDDDVYAAEAASWLLPNPKQGGGGGGVYGVKSSATASSAVAGGEEGNNKTGGCFVPSGGMDFFPDVDPYLDLEYASSMEAAARVSGSTDSVVPQSHGSGGGSVLDGSSASDGFDADPPCKGGYSYTSATSLSHSISSSSLDVGVVPDATLNDISTPYGRSGMFELAGHGAVHVGMHYTVPMDREAKVMRYKEKRKNRKFEKTIRYASRKAYAETRPRIKGRFAKRTDVDVEQMYTSADLGYGLVPTF